MNNIICDNHLDGDFGLTSKIKNALAEAASNFIYIGFLLKEADDLKYYLEGGYDNIYDYCEDNFGFGRSSTNNFIRVYRQFGSTNGIGLLDSYKAYSYSQLTEMCSMNVKQLNKCNPYMSVRELRAIKSNKPFSIKVKDTSASVVDKPIVFQTSGQLQFGPTGPIFVQLPRDFVVSFFTNCFGSFPSDLDVSYCQNLGIYNDDFVKRLFIAIGYNDFV